MKLGKRDRLRRFFSPSTGSLATSSAPEISSTQTNRPAPSATVKCPWADALQKLPQEDRVIIQKNSTELISPQSLLDAAIQRQKELEKHGWVLRVGGKNIVLRDVAAKIVHWINMFKGVGDIAVNFDPVHAALPWAGVRFLLQVAVVESQQAGALLIGLEKATYLIKRCRIYELLYLQSEHTNQEMDKDSIANLRSALVVLYAAILGFLASACSFYERSHGSRFFHGILNPEGSLTFVTECETLERKVDLEARNCEGVHADERGRKLKNLLTDLQNPILRVDSKVDKLCQNLDVEARPEILRWISTIPYKENHLTARQEWTKGTGEWLLNHEQYLKWRSSSSSSILWLHGIPGAGKTKLVSTVVDKLLTTFAIDDNDEAFAYFYCDRNQDDHRDPEYILASLVRQLSTRPRDDRPIQGLIYQIYDKERGTGFASGRLKYDQSLSLLEELVKIYPQVTIAVDALDECDRQTRVKLLHTLDELVDKSPGLLKMFISSRPDEDIKYRFGVGPNLEIKATDNRKYIERVVSERLGRSPQHWQRHISPALKAEIHETLIDKSEGMFQWVTLQLAQLFELSRERDIRERLGKLPDTLNKAYDEIYSQIQDQKGSSCDIANRAFQWIMYSRDPLSPDELVAAACQDPETEDVDNIDIDIDTVLGACCNLLVVDQQLKICKFSHLSVQEYLENHHWSYAKSNALIAKVCLTLLNHPIYQLQDIDDIDEGFSSDASCLLTYARFHWATHVQEYGESDIDSHLVSRLKKFLGSLNESSPAYQNWYSSIEKHFASDRSFYFGMPLYRIYKELSPSSRSILSISVFGFHAVISDWWTVASVYVEQTNCKGTTPLQLASIGGFIAVIQELTGREADVNAQGGSFGSALYEASYRGHEMVVRLLLEKGADVNAKGGKYGSALQAASDDGHEMVMRLLLDKGADVNAKGGKYGSALQAASYRGHEMVVRLLLEKGTNINAMGGRYGSALQTASYHGHEVVVRLLLEKEADNNAKGEGMYGSALLAASSRGYEMVVRLLLEKGTNINAMGGRYGSALQAASDGGHEAVMRLLLDKGADANAKGGGYGSALQAASEGGHETAMRLL